MPVLLWLQIPCKPSSETNSVSMQTSRPTKHRITQNDSGNMTGRELIEWIHIHKAEDYEIVVIREAGEKDFLYAGIDEPDEKNRQIVI